MAIVFDPRASPITSARLYDQSINQTNNAVMSTEH